MAFSGGTFSRTFDCTTDRDNGVKILASKFDTELDGMATGLSTCILKDGTQTCTAAIPFAQGITLPDNKTIAFGTNTDVLIQYDETTTDSLKISAAEGAGLAITLMADEGDDAGDEWKLNIADGGTLTLGNDINSAGTYVTHLTITPNATVANSTMAVAGNLTVGGALTLGSGAVISEAELETIDGITPGTVLASKAMVVDANKDITGGRNLTITGELDAATLDISGNADIDGTLEADAMTLNGSAITAVATLSTGISNGNLPVFTSGAADNDFLRIDGTAIEGRSAAEVLSDIGAQASLTFGISNTNAVKIDSASVADDEYARFTANGLESRATAEVLSDIAAAPAAGSSNILTTGALNSGSITSGFGSIDNGSSAITTTGTVTAGELTVNTSDQVLINHSGDGGGIRIDSTNNTNTGSVRFGDAADNYIGAVEYNHSTDAMSFYANNATRMTITSAGAVGIGTASPSAKAHIQTASSGSSVAGSGDELFVEGSGDAGITVGAGNTSKASLFFADDGDSAAGRIRYDHSDNSMQFGTAGQAERLRITSAGKIGIGTSSISSTLEIVPTDTNTIIETHSFNTTAQNHMQMRNNSGTEVGSIYVTTTSTAYNTSSDYRLKTAVTYDWDATSRLKKLKPARFAWIADGDDAVPVDGFLAHEVSHDSDGNPLVLEAISGTKDAMRDEEYQVSAATGDIYTPATDEADEVIHSANVENPDTLEEGQQWRETKEAVMGTRSVPDLQAIDQSKIVPLLTKALIESVEKIEALESRITALEAG